MASSRGSVDEDANRSAHDPTPTTQRANTSKRSCVEDDDAAEAERPKGKRRKKTKNRQHQDKEDLEIESRINNSTERMDPILLADFVARRMQRFASDLSLIELQDRHIPGTQGTDLAVVCLTKR